MAGRVVHFNPRVLDNLCQKPFSTLRGCRKVEVLSFVEPRSQMQASDGCSERLIHRLVAFIMQRASRPFSLVNDSNFLTARGTSLSVVATHKNGSSSNSGDTSLPEDTHTAFIPTFLAPNASAVPLSPTNTDSSGVTLNFFNA